MLGHAFHWLVMQGLYRDLVSATVLAPVMHVIAGKPLRRIHRAITRADQNEDVRASVRQRAVVEAIEEVKEFAVDDG